MFFHALSIRSALNRNSPRSPASSELLSKLENTAACVARRSVLATGCASREICHGNRRRGRTHAAHFLKSHMVDTTGWRNRCLCVVVLSQQASDCKPCSPQMLHVHIQVADATLRASFNDLQLNLPKSNPIWSLDCTFRHDVTVPSSLLRLCPRPRNINIDEIEVRAGATHSACIGLHAE
ncbi:unnamed protein product [Prorocentrum cordatum]|uniref:Uncharacterized protein n=1 Tax=Prorocentrum cordatum TaxID=2364126 RepID=A0ABN9QIP1_9DINO|nr:unnamed protein product [Polarella glacialis]